MHSLEYIIVFTIFTWLVVKVRSRRRLVATVLAGVTVVTLFGMPQPAHAKGGGLIGVIQAVLNVINGLLQNTLTSMKNVRVAVNTLQQTVVWPEELIDQARGQVTRIVGQYRPRMTNIFRADLNSATLPDPQTLEALIRDRQTNDFSSLSASFAGTYGPIPGATDASPSDRALSDMDDALTLDTLEMLKASDQAAGVQLRSADVIEDTAARAVPGSAPFLSATASAASIHGQAVMQKLIAAELRQEAAQIAHQNELRKNSASNTTQLRGILVNLLQHQ